MTSDKRHNSTCKATDTYYGSGLPCQLADGHKGFHAYECVSWPDGRRLVHHQPSFVEGQRLERDKAKYRNDAKARLATMNRAQWLAVLGIVAGVASIGNAVARATLTPTPGIHTDTTGHQTMLIGGGLRCCDWQVIEDATHQPTNLQAVGINGRISLSWPEALKVGALTITPDETLVRRGYSAGASVRRNGATVYCARHGRPVDCRELAGTSANLWVLGVMQMGVVAP